MAKYRYIKAIPPILIEKRRAWTWIHFYTERCAVDLDGILYRGSVLNRLNCENRWGRLRLFNIVRLLQERFLRLHSEETWWIYLNKHAEVGTNSVVHVECELNLGVETWLSHFLVDEVDGRLMPCVLSDHNYCIGVVVWSSCIGTNFVKRFHNGSRADSYFSWLKCADSEYEWTKTIQVKKHVKYYNLMLNYSEFDELKMTRFELVCTRSTPDWLVRGRGLSLRYLRLLVLVREKCLFLI